MELDEAREVIEHDYGHAESSTALPYAAHAVLVELDRAEDGPTVEEFGELSAQLDEVAAELGSWRALAERLERDVATLQAERDGLAKISTEALDALCAAQDENERLRAEIADYARRVTTGGPTKPIDTTWANTDLPAPASAHDPSAPPLRTGRGSDRMGEE